MNYNDNILQKASQFKAEYEEIQTLLGYNEVQGDTRYFKSLIERKNQIEKIAESYDLFSTSEREKNELNELLKEEKNIEMIDLYNEEIKNLNYKMNNFYLQIKFFLLTGKTISEGSLEIFAIDEELLQSIIKMYKFYCQNNNIQCDIFYTNETSARIDFKGNLAYERFALESGIHSLKGYKNINNFKIYCYKKYNENSEIKEEDLRYDVFRSSGAGGQNINKLSTAIRVTHIPTNITVICQDSRSQKQNKDRARENIKDKVNQWYAQMEQRQKNEVKNDSNKVVRVYDFDTKKVTQGDKIVDLDSILKEGKINIFSDEILIEEK